MSRGLLAFIAGVLILVSIGTAYILTNVSWDRKVVIEGGPTIGFFYETGEAINDYLRLNGVDSELTYRDDTLRIIGDVSDPNNPVNVGFIAQPVSETAFPNVVSLGSIVQEPLLFFANSDLGADLSIGDLIGKRVQVGPKLSGVRGVAMAALNAYELTPLMEIEEDPTSEAIAKVLRGESDAVALLFPPQTPIIENLALDPRLTLVDLPDSQALASDIGYVQQMTIPASSFDLADRIPTRDINTIGIPVTVIAHEDLPPGNVLLIAERLEQLFSGATVTSPAGTFPNFIDSQLPADPTAADYYTSGMPWQFRSLPHIIAEILIPLVVVGTVALFLNTLYKFFLPEMHSLFLKILGPQQRRKVLDSAEKRRAQGKPLTARQQRRLLQILAQSANQQSDDERARALLEDNDQGAGDDALGESDVSDRGSLPV